MSSTCPSRSTVMGSVTGAVAGPVAGPVTGAPSDPGCDHRTLASSGWEPWAMRALVITGLRSARVAEVEAPVPGTGQVVVDVRRAGLCGTDAELFNEQLAYFAQGKIGFPIRPGHEWCGVVSALGTGVDPGWLGVRVTGDTMLGCGRCPRCRAGRSGRRAPFRPVRGLGRPGAQAGGDGGQRHRVHAVHRAGPGRRHRDRRR
ncbi:MAG: alcohol dehydrogenase catalytic domain-containing protein [Streptosporangiales bacterium]